MDKTNVILFGASAALVLVLLSACGGGSDANAPETPAATAGVPDEASSSAAGMAGWMTRLAAAASDMLEPLDTARFNPPAPDDSEPEAVN